MGYYIILIALYLLLGFFESKRPVPSKQRNIVTFSLLLPMYALTAFRAETIGCDTLRYALLYNDLQCLDGLKAHILWSQQESGYVVLRYLFVHYNLSFFSFQIFISSIIYFSLFKYISRYSKNIALSCFLFLVTTRMFSTMNQTRMWLAISILLFSIPYLLDRKLVKFLVTVLLAYSFHKSALIFIVLYPLCTIKYSGKITTLIIVGSALIAFLGVNFMGWFTDTIGVYENYIDDVQFSEERSTLAASLTMAEMIVFFFLFKITNTFKAPQYVDSSISEKARIQVSHYMKMSFFMGLGLCVVGLSNNIMGRVSSYFTMVMVLLIPEAIKRITPSNKDVVYLLVCFVLIIEFAVKLVMRPYWYDVVPYVWGFGN